MINWLSIFEYKPLCHHLIKRKQVKAYLQPIIFVLQGPCNSLYGQNPVLRGGLRKTARPQSSLSAQPLLLFSLVSALICVSMFLLGVSWLTSLKEVISISLGGIKDVYLAETIQNTCSFSHSWPREDSAKNSKAGSPLPHKSRHTAPLVQSCMWIYLDPAGTTQMPQIFSARGLQPACGFSLEGWAVGRELSAPCQWMGTAAISNIQIFFSPQAVSN